MIGKFSFCFDGPGGRNAIGVFTEKNGEAFSCYNNVIGSILTPTLRNAG